MDGVSFENQTDQFYSTLSEQGQKNFSQNSYSSIFGQTCDGGDIVANNLSCPQMNVGDWIVFGGMGNFYN